MQDCSNTSPQGLPNGHFKKRPLGNRYVVKVKPTPVPVPKALPSPLASVEHRPLSGATLQGASKPLLANENLPKQAFQASLST